MELLRQEVEHYINDPRRVSAMVKMISDPGGIADRYRISVETPTFIMFTDDYTLYDGDVEGSGCLMVINAEYGPDGRIVTGGGPFIYGDYAVNTVGGQLVVSEFSRVNFDSVKARLAGIIGPVAEHTNMTFFHMDEDAKANTFLRLLTLRV